MRLKTVLILAGLLVGLGMVSLVRSRLQRSRGPDFPLKGVTTSEPLGTPEAIVKVEIHQSAQTVTLERVNNLWELKTPVAAPADELMVKPLLEGLTKLAVGGVLSSRPERHTQFQVTEASGTTVQVWTTGPGKSPPPFIVGKSVPEGTGVYFRYKGSNEVHLAEGLATYHLNRSVKDWRDKTILRLTLSDIEGVELTHANPRARVGGSQFALVKTSDTWYVVGKGEVPGPSERGQPADAGKVDALLATLASLDADDFIDPPQASDLATLGLSPPALTIHLKAKTQEVTLALGIPQPFSSAPSPPPSPTRGEGKNEDSPSPTPSGTPLRKDALPQIFLISNYKAEALNKKLADLIQKPPAKK
ncbi:MAG: DUF4340 domain-containing protein [Elusimicrobia bacterium]|nr:DUF4340 domain-containing protein [Elusimicrobiota bacterium]